MTQFKSDARPSDTKSVVLNKEGDARLLAHLKTTKKESAFWRQAGYFYLDFMAWLDQAGLTDPGAPLPGQPFEVYRPWLEQRQPAAPAEVQARIDPASIAAAILPGVRDVVEAALSTALGAVMAGQPVTGQPARSEDKAERVELADLFSAELVLE